MIFDLESKGLVFSKIQEEYDKTNEAMQTHEMRNELNKIIIIN